MQTEENTGRLIVVCGIDGSGKTLQSKKLHSRLVESGFAAEYVEFPRYGEGFFGDLVGKYLRGELSKRGGELDPYLASLPFACDRWEFSGTLRRWLDAGKVVVCNRYVSANMAHQGGKISSDSEREAFYNWVEEMEYRVFGVPKPRIHLWLDMLPSCAISLIGGRKSRDYAGGEDDIHENVQHLRKARRAYAELARRDERGWVRIECCDEDEPCGAEQIAAMVWERVSPHFSQNGGFSI